MFVLRVLGRSLLLELSREKIYFARHSYPSKVTSVELYRRWLQSRVEERAESSYVVKADWRRQCDVQRVTVPIESGGRGVVSETWGVKERERNCTLFVHVHA